MSIVGNLAFTLSVSLSMYLLIASLQATFCNQGQILQLLAERVDHISFRPLELVSRFALGMQQSKAWWLMNQFLGRSRETSRKTEYSHTAKQTGSTHGSKTDCLHSWIHNDSPTDFEFQSSKSLFSLQ